MSPNKKVVVVFGATGNQGGSVIDSILNDPKAASQFQLRGITRKVDSDKAKALKAKGVEVVAADLEDKASINAAFKGAYGAFAVTNFWESLNPQTEEDQGRRVAEAAKEEGLQHLVWSSLLNIEKLSNGVLPDIHHFDAKARVEDYINELGVPATHFLPGFFMSNIPGWMQPSSDKSSYTLYLPIPPTSPVPHFDAADDTGKWVKAILLKRDQTLGKRIYGATSYQTLDEITKDFGSVVGKETKFQEVPHEDYKKTLAGMGMPPVLQEEMLQNMRLMNEFGYYGGESLDFSHSILDEQPTTWKDFLAKDPQVAKLK